MCVCVAAVVLSPAKALTGSLTGLPTSSLTGLYCPPQLVGTNLVLPLGAAVCFLGKGPWMSVSLWPLSCCLSVFFFSSFFWFFFVPLSLSLSLSPLASHTPSKFRG